MRVEGPALNDGLEPLGGERRVGLLRLAGEGEDCKDQGGEERGRAHHTPRSGPGQVSGPAAGLTVRGGSAESALRGLASTVPPSRQ